MPPLPRASSKAFWAAKDAKAKARPLVVHLRPGLNHFNPFSRLFSYQTRVLMSVNFFASDQESAKAKCRKQEETAQKPPKPSGRTLGAILVKTPLGKDRQG